MFLSEVVDSVASSRLIHVHRGAIAPSDAVHESVCFVKVIKSIQKDQIDVVLQRTIELRQHIHSDEASKTKGGCLVEPR